MNDDDTTKPTNPKDVVGCKKPPLSALSGPALYEVGAAVHEGTCKYGRHNVRDAGVRADIYFDATQRHLWAWWEGQDIDPDSGLSHITKAIASLWVFRDAMIANNWVDNRPPRIDPEFLEKIQERVDEINSRYPNPKPPHTEIDR